MSNSKPDFTPYTEKQEKFGTSIIKKYGKFQVVIYRLTGGRLLNTFLGGPVHLCRGQAHLSPFRSLIDRYSLSSIIWETPVGRSKHTGKGNYHDYRYFNLLSNSGCWRMAAKPK